MSAITTPTKTAVVGGTPFAYRELGPQAGVPLLLLHHFTAVLDDWDPAVLDGLAAERRVIAVDLRGVGASGGATPDSFEAMADDAAAFAEALGLDTVDLLGFSLGGMVAQAVAQQRPRLVRRLVLAGTAPASEEGVSAPWGARLQAALEQAGAEGKHPKHFLFFTPSAAGQAAASDLLARLDQRADDRDTPVTNETIGAQLTAAAKWEQASSPAGLATLTQPSLIVNGDHDTMVPTTGSFSLAGLLPSAQLAIYPDAGHGGIFQYHALFVQQVLDFLRD
jgi:pimeloyl-ACP methyl ester carboxylesterase